MSSLVERNLRVNDGLLRSTPKRTDRKRWESTRIPIPSASRSHQMRAILRRGISVSTSMAAAAAAAGPSYRLRNLIHQLRLYNPSPSDEDDVDDRGKVFSHMGLAESAAPPTALRRPDPPTPKRAAVLVCLFEDGLGDLRVILTKRSSSLSTHSGEVSLPGGKAEEGDADDQDTATREAKEEIGLDPALVTVVAVLEPFLSKHLLRVVPVIGILTDRHAFKPVVNSDEVEEIFDAPLEMFLKDESRRWEEREWLGSKYTVHYFDYEVGEKRFVIWGLTATILIRTAAVVFRRPPDFPEQQIRFDFLRSSGTNHRSRS